MTELKETGYRLETGDLSSTKELLNKIQTAFVSDDYFLLETPREYLSGKVSELTEDKLNKLISVKVFSDKAEFSAESCNGAYSYRSITDDDSSSDKAFTRETGYLLRKALVNKAISQAGYNKIKNKEYFKSNDDGMPVKEFDRLCGYEKGE